MIRPYNRALGAKGKHANRASPDGNAPLSPPAAVLLHGKASHVIFRSLRFLTNHVRLPPQRGKSALRSAFVLISISKHSAAKISPSGGEAAAGGRRGVFPSPAGRFACFPLARQGGCMVLSYWRLIKDVKCTPSVAFRRHLPHL